MSSISSRRMFGKGALLSGVASLLAPGLAKAGLPPSTLAGFGITSTQAQLNAVGQQNDFLASSQAAIIAAGATPASLGGMLVLQLYADQGVTTDAGVAPTNGQGVRNWADVRAGGGGMIAIQATDSLQPTWIKNAYGAMAALRYNGATTNHVTDTDALRPDSGPFHIFAVVRNKGAGTATLLQKGNASSSAIGYSMFTQYAFPTVSQYSRCAGASSSLGSQGVSLPVNCSLIELVLDGTGTITGFLNSSATGWTSGGGGPTGNSYTPPISNTDNLNIGGAGTFDLFALLIFKPTVAMTTDQVNLVRNYLQARYPIGTPAAVNYGTEQTLWSSGVQAPITRIPAIAVCNSGTILAFAEMRQNNNGASPDAGTISIALKRSLDNGVTFGAQIAVAGDGTNTFHNPAPIVDRSTGRVHLLYCHTLAGDTQATIEAGTSTDTARAFYTYSDNDGLTWSTAVEITSSVKPSTPSAALFWNPGPGGTVQLANGRLLWPCYYSSTAEGGTGTAQLQSYLVYSDDHGATFHIGAISGTSGGNECHVTQRPSDGLLFIRIRDDSAAGWYYTATSADNGLTMTTPVKEIELVNPNCNGTWLFASGSSAVMINSRPASVSARVNMTIDVSTDSGATWPASSQVYTGTAGYSDMALLADGTYGLIYEQGSSINLVWAKFTVAYPKWST